MTVRATRITGPGRCSASYSVHAGKRIGGISIPLRNYKQHDNHSCGFIAALTVARYYDPSISSRRVINAVRPSVNHGVDRHRMMSALDMLGIDAQYNDDLTITRLRAYIRRSVPVIVSVWPDGWGSDHWTVVQGFTDSRIYLSNHRSLTLIQFAAQWSDMDMTNGHGNSKEGIVCYT